MHNDSDNGCATSGLVVEKGVIAMVGKKMNQTQCPIAQSLNRVGEWWSILILRDAHYGLTRFDEFLKSLGIAPNMLTRRLNGLVDAGLLARHQYSLRPPRFEYRLTEAGIDFKPVLFSLLAWGNRHFAAGGLAVVVGNVKTGDAAEPIVVDAKTGQSLDSLDYRLMAGPAADERIRRRYQSENPYNSEQKASENAQSTYGNATEMRSVSESAVQDGLCRIW